MLLLEVRSATQTSWSMSGSAETTPKKTAKLMTVTTVATILGPISIANGVQEGSEEEGFNGQVISSSQLGGKYL